MKQISINVLIKIFESKKNVFKTILSYIIYKDIIDSNEILEELNIKKEFVEQTYKTYQKYEISENDYVLVRLDVLKEEILKESKELPFGFDENWYKKQLKAVLCYSDNFNIAKPVIKEVLEKVFGDE